MKFAGVPAYKNWRDNKLINQARANYELEDYDAAFLAIRKVLRQNESPEAWDLGVNIIRHLPQQRRFVPAYLLKLTELDPIKPEYFNTYCLLALKLNNPEAAKEVYEKYPEIHRTSNIYHEIGYRINSATSNSEGAEIHLQELIKNNPDNLSYLYSLSVLNLKNPDQEKQNTAEETLRGFVKNDDYKLHSIRALLTFFIISERAKDANEMAELLESSQETNLRDQLLIAQSFTTFDSSRFDNKWKFIQNWKFSQAADVVVVLDFLLRNSKFDEALDWLPQIPVEYMNESFVSQKVGQVYYLNQDWGSLQTYLQSFGDTNDTGWNEKEFGRFLLMALASRIQGNEMEFRGYWEKSLAAMGNNKEYLKNTFGQTIKWGWSKEAITVLEKLFQMDATDTEIYSLLMNYYIKTGQTQRLIELLSKRLEIVPDDNTSKNNLALLSLLLESNVSSAFSFAQANFQEEPNNPHYLTTWAFALAAQGRTEEALDLLGKLPEEEAKKPDRIIYLASIYMDSGQAHAAAKLLSEVTPTLQVPEEEALMKAILKEIEDGK